jgi:hypothetical protein
LTKLLAGARNILKCLRISHVLFVSLYNVKEY